MRTATLEFSPPATQEAQALPGPASQSVIPPTIVKPVAEIPPEPLATPELQTIPEYRPERDKYGPIYYNVSNGRCNVWSGVVAREMQL